MDGTLTCCISVTAGFPRSPLFWLAPFQVPSLVSSSCVWCQSGFFRGASDCFCFRMCAGSFLPGRADRQGAPGPSEALPVWGLACWVRPFPLTDHQPAPTPLWCGWDPRESLGTLGVFFVLRSLISCSLQAWSELYTGQILTYAPYGFPPVCSAFSALFP